MSVGQSSSSVVFGGSRKPDVERNVDQSLVFGVTRSTCNAHSKFSENTQNEKMVDGSGQPDTQFIQLEEKPPDGHMWFGERLTRKQLT